MHASRSQIGAVIESFLSSRTGCGEGQRVYSDTWALKHAAVQRQTARLAVGLRGKTVIPETSDFDPEKQPISDFNE
jgi:hypothetical protein